MRTVVILAGMLLLTIPADAIEHWEIGRGIRCDTYSQAMRLAKYFEDSLERGWLRYSVENGRYRAYKTRSGGDQPCALDTDIRVFDAELLRIKERVALYRANLSLTRKKRYEIFIITVPGAAPDFTQKERRTTGRSSRRYLLTSR